MEEADLLHKGEGARSLTTSRLPEHRSKTVGPVAHPILKRGTEQYCLDNHIRLLAYYKKFLRSTDID